MRPVPPALLLALLLGLCALCGVQWWRESVLRELAAGQARELAGAAAERGELVGRLKAADAEILRLTAAHSDLRSNSVSAQVHEEAIEAARNLREAAEKLGGALRERDAALARQNAAVGQANESIRKLAAERDDLARRLNEVTARHNKLLEERK